MSKLADLHDGDYWQLPWGRIEVHNNEVWVISEVNDAPGISLVGPNSKISFKTPDGIERVLLEPRINQAGDGELYIGCLDQAKFNAETARGNPKAGDTAMIEVATINPKQIETRVPVKMSAGFNDGATGGHVTRFYSDDGVYCFNVQGPGSGQPSGVLIQYRTVDAQGQPILDESQWTPVAKLEGAAL